MRVRLLTEQEKSSITGACERLIAETLKPRYLAETRPPGSSCPIDIFGRWRGKTYSFIARYRRDEPVDADPVFDVPFARLDSIEEGSAEIRFDVMWLRHSGRWWRRHAAAPREGALRHGETDAFLRPPL